MLKRCNVDSLSWIAKLVYEPFIEFVASPSDSPIKDMQGLLKTIKKKRKKIVIAGFVRGSSCHVAWAMLMVPAQIPSDSVNWVPYDRPVGDGGTRGASSSHGACYRCGLVNEGLIPLTAGNSRQ